MIEKADLTDKAVNQIAEIIKEPIKEKDKEIERLNNIIVDINKILNDDDLCHIEKLQKINKLLDKGE